MLIALSDLWPHLQRQLFPLLAEELGPRGARDGQFVQVLSLLPLGPLLLRYQWKGIGCPPHARAWLLHAFLAKTVYGFATTELPATNCPSNCMSGRFRPGAIPRWPALSAATPRPSKGANGPSPSPSLSRNPRRHAPSAGPKKVKAEWQSHRLSSNSKRPAAAHRAASATGRAVRLDPAQRRRFQEQTASERMHCQFQDQYGARTVRVHGPVKVMAHLMFGGWS